VRSVAKPITLRAPADLIVRLEGYATKYPLLSQHRIALLALSRGLDAMDGDPRWFEKVAKGE
jgi:hypothetical protein